jgi:hypothetical protein
MILNDKTLNEICILYNLYENTIISNYIKDNAKDIVDKYTIYGFKGKIRKLLYDSLPNDIKELIKINDTKHENILNTFMNTSPPRYPTMITNEIKTLEDYIFFMTNIIETRYNSPINLIELYKHYFHNIKETCKSSQEIFDNYFVNINFKPESNLLDI